MWFKALTISGKPCGLAFECEQCHLGYAHDAPERIFHCGAWESAPKVTALLQTRRIGGDAALPQNMFKIGVWNV